MSQGHNSATLRHNWNQMDPYHHHTPPVVHPQQVISTTSTNLNSTAATSNYVVHLDPNSGHFEIIDSSLATIPSNQRGVEVGGVSGENDEAVYKIRDEDFYLRGPLTDQTFQEIDVDPMVGDIFALSRNLQYIQPQIQQAQEGVPQFQMQMQLPTVQSHNVQQMSSMQFLPQNHVHQVQGHGGQVQNQGQAYCVTLDDFGGIAIPAENYQVQQQQQQQMQQIPQIQIQQQHPQILQQQPITSVATSFEGDQAAPMMTVMTNLISPGATALQMNNNILICNPGGQIFSIPLPGQGQQSTSGGSTAAATMQYQAVPVTAPGAVTVMSTACSSSPAEVHYQLVPQPNTTQVGVPMSIQFQQDTVPVVGTALPTGYNVHENVQQQFVQTTASPVITINETPQQVTAVKSVPQYVIDQCDNIQQSPNSSFIKATEKPVVDSQSQNTRPTNQISVITSVTSSPATTTSPPKVVIVQPPEEETESEGKVVDVDEVDSAPSSNIVKAVISVEEDIQKINNNSSPDSEKNPPQTDTDDNNIESEEFEIKIVSCFSQSQQVSQQEEEEDNKKEEEDKKESKEIQEKAAIKTTEEIENYESNNNNNMLKEEDDVEESKDLEDDVETEALENLEEEERPRKRIKLDKFEPQPQSKTPNIPLWLEGYVDKDDELLIAFQNRSDLMRTDICQFCYAWFYSKKQLNAHIKEAHVGKDKFHSCTACGAKFAARVLRLRHEKLHKYDLKYRSVVYLRYPNLRTHFRRRYRPARFSEWYTSSVTQLCNLVDELPFECFDCGGLFSSSDYVQEHYNQVHALQICGFCGTICSNFDSLIQHEQEIHGNYAVTKNYEGGAWNLWDHWQCEESLKKDILLSNIAYFHNYLKPDNDAPKVIEEDFVDLIPEVDDDTVALQNVTITEQQEEETTSAANDVGLVENSVSVGNDAEDIIENGVLRPRLPFACDQCQKSYDNEHDLKRHARCHVSHSPSKANLACQFCGRNFKTHSHKKEHERTHTGEKPYTCPICQRSFIQSSNLKKHIQTHQQTSLQCSICGKQFIKEASLILHQRAHAQDRKFRCAICDRAYNYASLLKRHMRIHTGEMPYSCESCGMLFHELVSLHYHRKKVHTGERPHKCETCGRAFILSSDLKKHVQIHLKPPSDRPILKPLRKRSQSKSIEKIDNLVDGAPLSPIISSAVSISNPSGTLAEQTTSVIRNLSVETKSDCDDEEVLLMSPSPCSSLENEIISNKPPVVRVYSRRDTKASPTPNCKERVVGMVDTNEGYLQEQAMEVDTQEISFGNHAQVVENSHQVPSTSTSGMNLYRSLVTTQEEAEMLLGIHEERTFDFSSHAHMYSNSSGMLDSSSFTQVSSAETMQKNMLEEVLQLGVGSFPDFDMNNIIISSSVPEAASEIEIILDDKNHSMR